MKKVLFTIVAFLSFALFIQAAAWDVNYDQPVDGIYQLDFSTGTFVLGEFDDGNVIYSKIFYDHSIVTTQKGFAELPYLNASIILDETRNVSVKVIPGQFEDIQLTYPLLPSRGIIYRNQDPSQVPYEIDPKSLSDSWYPKDLATATDPFIIRDLRGTSVYVNPFQYNAANNVLRVYKNITVQLIENDTPSINPLQIIENEIEREMDGIYQSVFVNYNDVRDELTIGQYGDILVITTDRDDEAIQPYIDWKREKGFNVSMEVVATGTNVVSMVQDAYDANNDLLYVQLVGDWAELQSNMLSGYAPMDPQVGCVVGSDDYADIAVGRFSASSADEVTVMVNKSINYEQNPDMEDWYKASTGVASNQGPGDDNEDDNEHVQNIYDNKLVPELGYNLQNQIYDPSGSIQDVLNAVNGGTSIINYCGHGSTTSWGSTGFSNSNVAQLTNGSKLPFIISVACVNGEFNNGTCFAEAWTRKENGGAVIFLGATINQPWDPPMRGQDYMNDVFVGGYNYDEHPGQNGINTDEQRTTLGALVFNGLTLMCVEAGGSSDWETAKTWTLFGDAALQARSDMPGEITLSNNTVMAGIPFTTTVNGPDGPFEGAMVCISNGEDYYSGVTDASGNVSIEHSLVPGNATLTVTGFNLATIYDEIVVASSDEAWVIVNSFDIDDSQGDDNGMADYNEDIMLDVMAENVGSVDAENVTAILSTEDENVNITNNSYDFGDIDANQVVEGYGAFEFTVNETVTDGHTVVFDIEFTDNSESSWAGTIPVTLHAPVLDFNGYTLDDQGGNGNGKFDPGETVELSIEVINNGSAGSIAVGGELICLDPYITIDNASMEYGDLEAGETMTKIFTVTAEESTPEGHYVEFNLEIVDEHGYQGLGVFTEVVGQIPVVIIDLDPNNSSGPEMQVAMEDNGIVPEYVTSIPDDLNLYSSVFLCLGIYSSNYTLDSGEGQVLADFLNDGGNLYMEGGDTWAFDTQTAVHAMFNINGTDDGSSDMGTVNGKSGTFTEGMSFNYSGENNWMDHLSPVSPAFTILENQSPNYSTAVAYDAEDYRTIGASHEFGGLDDAGSPSTKMELMAEYLEFFGISGEQQLLAYFIGDDTEICDGESVNFSDLSQGPVESWSWEFPGGNPATSNEQNPTVVYETAGTYDVTLTITGGGENNTYTREAYIIVDECSGIGEIEFAEVNIYPNPSQGQFAIELTNDYRNNAEIKVYSSYGVLVYDELTENTNSMSIDLSNLDSGVYYIIIENDQQRVVKQVMIK